MRRFHLIGNAVDRPTHKSIDAITEIRPAVAPSSLSLAMTECQGRE
jgi:hypothetical protein